MKSKALKQREAVERKLKHVPILRAQYHASFPGTTRYKEVAASWGTDHANIWHKEHRLRLERLCTECGIDIHGNLLELK